MANHLNSYLKSGVESSSKYLLKDIEAMTPEQLASSPAGSARPPFDFVYEIVVVNQRIADRLNGKDPGPWTAEGWIVCPDEWKDKGKLSEAIKDTSAQIVAGLEGKDDSQLTEKFKVGENETCFADMAGLAAVHMMYHGGQLNYVQSMNGDMEVHWN
ncbi:DinB family protein [Kamptonema cortianum]|nr:DinB family protein [Geitlerinema splendidum]MDK3158623.1 DinB family protein [Kamptonema cortianum]